MNRQKRYSPIQKVEILREHLENHVTISELCKKYQVTPTIIYRWKKQLFEGATELFRNNGKKDNQTIKELQVKLRQKDEVISEIVADNIQLKKKLTGIR